nr:hypothetical protein [Tanacetum cinerariifolium]
MTAHHNDWDTSAQWSESSSSITSSFDPKIASLKSKMAEINKNLMRVLQVNQQVKAVTPNCETCGSPHSYSDCPATVGQTQNVHALGAYQGGSEGYYDSKWNCISRTHDSYISSSFPVVEHETEAKKDTVHPTNNGRTKDVQPPVVQTESPILIYEPVVAPIIKPVVAPVSAPKPSLKPLILYPSRLHDQKLRDKSNDQKEKFFQIFKDLNFNISFTDALILMPKFGPTIKTLLTNKDKLSELAITPLNEHCSVVLLKKLSLHDLSPTCMTLELADRLISRPVGVTKDVFVKVGTFHFPTDFVVIDFDVDPRVPLILGRSFLKTERALIDVFEGELTLHVGKEALTFNLNQTSRYSANYNDMTANHIDVIDIGCEDYSQEVLNFSDVIASGNSTPYYDPIVSTSSLTLTLFRESDFLLEEVDTFLALEDDSTLPEIDQSYLDSKGDILLLESFLNDDPSLPTPNQGNYLPQVRKELQICKAKSDKSSIDEPPKVELKDLPPHLEYAFLEEKDFKSVVQHQRMVNPKIYDVIKQDVLKFLDFRLIYPISDSPWEKIHFMVKEGIVLGHKISKDGIEVDKAKVDVIAKLPHLTTVKDHSALKYLFAKNDSKTRLLHWVQLLQEFTLQVIDTKGAKNLATDHLSRLENPHQNVLDRKEINKSFPLETLNMVSFYGNSSTLWFFDFANYHAGNFIELFEGVYTTRKPLTFSRLATMDPSGDITDRFT